jgi:hypothetical protein
MQIKSQYNVFEYFFEKYCRTSYFFRENFYGWKIYKNEFSHIRENGKNHCCLNPICY